MLVEIRVMAALDAPLHVIAFLAIDDPVHQPCISEKSHGKLAVETAINTAS